MYGQTRYHRTYAALYNDINALLVIFIDPKAKHALALLKNALYRMEETLRLEPIDFSDFITQLRIRIGKRPNDQHVECILPALFRDSSASAASLNLPIFRTVHHHLLENAATHALVPGCEQATATVLASGGYYVAFESGVIIEASLKNHEITRILLTKNYAPCTLSLAPEAETLISGGFGPTL